MNIEPFLVASTVRVVVGQRLVRKICEQCKFEVLHDDLFLGLVSSLGLNNPQILERTFFRGVGCESCFNTGYSGRTVIAEVLVVDDEVRDLVMRKASARNIHACALRKGMTPILLHGVEKASSGLTTIEELVRVLHD